MKGEKIEVYNPVGSVEMTATPAPRVTDLHGKTICTLWNGLFRGNETFPYLQQLLKERYPDANIVPYTELPISHPHDTRTIGEAARQKGCDVVIGGNGG